MGADNKLELVIEVDATAGNVAIKGMNQNLGVFERQAVSASKMASSGIDGWTRQLVHSRQETREASEAAHLLGNQIGLELPRAVRRFIGESQTIGPILAQAFQLGILVAFAAALVKLISELPEFIDKLQDMALGLGRSREELAKNAEEMQKLGDHARALRNEMSLIGAGGLVKMTKEVGIASEGLSEAKRRAAQAKSEYEDLLKQQQKQDERVEWQKKHAIAGTMYMGAGIEAGMNWLFGVRQAQVDESFKKFQEAEDKVRQARVGSAEAQSKLNDETERRRIDVLMAGIEAQHKGAEIQKLTVGLKSQELILQEAIVNNSAKDAVAAKQKITDLQEQLKIAEGLRSLSRDQIKSSLEFRRSAEESAFGGAAKQIMEVQKEREKLTTFIDEKGTIHRVELVAAARENIEAALQAKIQALQRDSLKRNVKDYEDVFRKRGEADTQYYQKKLEYEESLANQQVENNRNLMRFQEERAGMERDAALRQVGLAEEQILKRSGPKALEQKIALEARKADIETQYLNQVHDVKTALFDQETAQIIAQLNLQKEILSLAGQDTKKISQMIGDIENQRKQLRGQMDEQTQAAIDAAKENAAVRQAQIVRDEQQRTFDSFKRQAEGVFDALTTKSQSVFSAIGNAFKTAILTAIKEIVTSQVARMLMQLFGRLRIPGVASAQAGASGPGIGGVFAGILPSFIPSSVTNGEDRGIPSFVPGQGGQSGGGMFGNLGGLFKNGQWMNTVGSAATMGGGLFMLSGLQKGSAGRTIAGGGIMGAGIGLAGGPIGALGGAGIGLGLAGLQRGGLSGLGMTTAGGAMLGFNLGGPIGAAIGAGIGFLAGLVRLFVKGAQEKAREKIKATYGVDIKDKGVLAQIVDIAKQGFGGNLDMAIRSQQVRDLVELYAMSTGQTTAGLPAKMTSSTLVQMGGSIYQQPAYSNGAPGKGMGGSLPSAGLDQIRAGVAANAGTTVINISVPGAKEFFQKETLQVVAHNPRAVQSSSTTAMKGNYNRRELTSLQLSPGTLTS